MKTEQKTGTVFLQNEGQKLFDLIIYIYIDILNKVFSQVSERAYIHSLTRQQKNNLTNTHEHVPPRFPAKSR